LHPQGRRPLDDSPPGPSDVQQPDPHPTPPGAGRVEARVIQRCLQKDPAGRYQQVTQLLDDLEQPLASEHQGASDEQATELLQAACRCAADRQFKKAARLCEEILQRWPNHGPAAHLLDELHAREEQGRELYAAVESGLDSRDLEELLRLLERAIEVWPDHPSRPQLQIRLAERARQYAEAMELGVESTGRADFQSARSWFQRALQQNPGSGEAKRCLDLVERILHDKQDARGRIDAAIAAGNGDLALAIARRIDAEIRGLVESARRPDTGGRP
jgi:tetratricopeptide (TPR) repeat protein